MEFVTFVDVKYMTIRRGCANGIYICETWNMKQKVENIRCGVWKRKGGVGSIVCQVWNVKYEEVVWLMSYKCILLEREQLLKKKIMKRGIAKKPRDETKRNTEIFN